MPDASPTSAPKEGSRGSLARVAVGALLEGVEQARRADLVGPPPSARVRQFIHGACLPFVVWRRLVRTPEGRRRYWRTVLAQALVTVAVALAFVIPGDRWSRGGESEAGGLRDEARELRDKAQGLQESADALAEVRARGGLSSDLAKEAAASAAEAMEGSGDLVADLREAARGGQEAIGPDEEEEPEGRGAPSPGDEEMGQLAEKTQREVEGAAGPEAKLRAAAAGLDEGARRLEQRADRLDTEQASSVGAFRWLVQKGLLFWAALVSALYSVQMIVLWLTRDFHDAISREASLAVGVEPEDPPARPRVRLNLRWARTKLRRRWRGGLAIFTAVPLIWAATLPFPSWIPVRSALMSAWLAYWWIVFTAARSARAWMEPARDPWYLRGWTFVTSRVPLFRWGLPRTYGRLWRHFTLELYAPSTCVELQPYAMAGLAVTRFLGNVPVVKLFARPLFPVATALLVEERRRLSPAPAAPPPQSIG